MIKWLSKSLIFSSLSASVLSGCNITPIPDNLPGVSTTQIMRQIRCETRHALARYLRVNLLYATDDLYAQEIAKTSLRDDFAKRLDKNKLSPRMRSYVSYFENSAIVYDFSFNVSESNNTSTDLDFFRTMSSGTLSLGLKGGIELSRSNNRVLTVSDTFRTLLVDVENDYCDNAAKGVNFVYPITGTIGMDEKVATFVDSTLFNGLTGKEGKGPPTIVDETEFVTKISGSISPKAELTNTLKAGSISHDTSRIDKHKVIIGISIPPDAVFKPAQNTPRYVVLQSGATPAQRQAAEAVNQYISRFEAGRAVIYYDGL